LTQAQAPLQTDPRSLTPNQDAAARFMATVRDKLNPEMAKEGRPGMVARMQLVFFSSLATVVAGERDHGSTDRDIRECCALALGDTLASLSSMCSMLAEDARFEERHAAIAVLADNVRGRAINSVASGKVEHMAYRVATPGKG